ncbi:hypothetical protein BEL05_00705 [Shewanella colwelliana]|uniref:Uncharacterized protein n=1 Tax=Shewanella colwelliana TaxID=23 RepID=A0A1E5IUE2_SHECO|nr:hypothetical protein [Shewanella colwelliana]OEG74152.1 hypothetical protein BEL05_00705 [Shewanella colwelliana]
MRIYKQPISKNIDAICHITKKNTNINIIYHVSINEVTTVICDELEIEINMTDKDSHEVDHYMIIGKNKGEFVLYSKTDNAFLDEEAFKKLRINIKTKK